MILKFNICKGHLRFIKSQKLKAKILKFAYDFVMTITCLRQDVYKKNKKNRLRLSILRPTDLICSSGVPTSSFDTPWLSMHLAEGIIASCLL